MADVEALVAAAREHDIVVAQELPPVVLARLAGGPVRLVADLYNALVVELLEGGAPRRTQRRIAARTLALCAAADLVLCANERQRDLLIGGMALHGLLDPETYARDPTLRSLVAVVPFGLPDGPAPEATGALRAAFPAIAPGDRVLLWGGGVWDWLDAETPLRALERLDPGGPPRHARSRPPGAGGERTGGGRRAVPGRRRAAGCSERACTSTRGWVPYAERGAVARRGRPRGLRAPRSPRGALRAPHAPARRAVGGAAGRHHARRRAGRADRARAARRDRRARATSTATPRRARGCSGRTAPAPGRGWRRRRRRCAGACWRRRSSRGATSAPPRRRVRRDVVRRAALTQYRWALAETLGEQGPVAAARRVGRRLRRAVRLR